MKKIILYTIIIITMYIFGFVIASVVAIGTDYKAYDIFANDKDLKAEEKEYLYNNKKIKLDKPVIKKHIDKDEINQSEVNKYLEYVNNAKKIKIPKDIQGNLLDYIDNELINSQEYVPLQ